MRWRPGAFAVIEVKSYQILATKASGIPDLVPRSSQNILLDPQKMEYFSAAALAASAALDARRLDAPLVTRLSGQWTALLLQLSHALYKLL